MNRLLLGPKASIGYWKRNSIETTRKCGKVSLDGFIPEVEIVEHFDFEKYGYACDKVDIWVDRPSSRRSIKSMECKVLKGDVPPESFRRIANNLYVMSPEFCLVEAARSFDASDLVMMGMEMCGLYRLKLSSTGEMASAFPISSARQMRTYASNPDVQKYLGRRSASVMAQVTKHILDGSASPAETSLSMLFSMPMRYGGEATPIPTMNGNVILEKSAAGKAGIDSLHCDLLWPNYNIAIEYDSDKYHSGYMANRKDARRNNLLVFSNVTLFRITKPVVESEMLLHEIALQLKQRMKVSCREFMDLEKLERARQELRNKVCPYMGLRYW